MKIKLYLSFLLLLALLVNSKSTLCKSKESNSEGQSCKNDDFKCDYTMFCNSKEKCQKVLNLGDKCTRDNECFGNYGNRKCIHGKCKLELFNGEGPCQDLENWFCTNGTICLNNKCMILHKCTLDTECPFNQYCNKTSGSCVKSSEKNSCTRGRHCPETHICLNGECIEKFSKKIGEGCSGNSELCNGFDQLYCNQNDKKCHRFSEYGDNCTVTLFNEGHSTCGAGKCKCNPVTGDLKCVNHNGIKAKKECLKYFKQYNQCMTDKHCSVLSPFTCKSCFDIFECFESQCYFRGYSDHTKLNYYKSLNCSRLLK